MAHRVDEDAVIFLNGFAVWIAAMVDPARVIAADFRIDYFAAFEAEQECMRIVLVIGSVLPGNALTGVFDDPGALGDWLRRVHSAAMHAGLADLDPWGWLSSFGFLRHGRSVKSV